MLKLVALVLGLWTSCSANMLSLEVLLNKDSRIGDAINLLQVLCLVLLSLRKQIRHRRRIPFASIGFCSVLYYLSSSLNLWSLQYGISVPLYIVFRSSSLLTTFLFSLVFQRKPVYFLEASFVLLTSCGLFVVSWATRASSSVEKLLDLSERGSVKGLFCILLGSVLSPLMSIVQEEVLSHQEEKAEASEELLFYMQLFSLLGYVFQAKQLFSVTWYWLSSQSLRSGPNLVFLLLNLVTQVICIRSVFTMSAQVNAVALQMTLSVRKLLSLLISYYYFNHHLTKFYWFGAFMTFFGSLLYSFSTNRRERKAKE